MPIKDAPKDRDAEERVRAAMKRLSEMPVLDRRPANEILGYNQAGVWDNH